MRKHGRGAKIVYVRRYRRWRGGKLETVRDALRSANPPKPMQASDSQLILALRPAS